MALASMAMVDARPSPRSRQVKASLARRPFVENGTLERAGLQAPLPHALRGSRRGESLRDDPVDRRPEPRNRREQLASGLRDVTALAGLDFAQQPMQRLPCS